MKAHVLSVQNGIKTPNEARDGEELALLPSGDELLIQGATVPIANQLNAEEE